MTEEQHIKYRCHEYGVKLHPNIKCIGDILYINNLSMSIDEIGHPIFYRIDKIYLPYTEGKSLWNETIDKLNNINKLIDKI